jgi:hypothetical protein
MCGYWEEPSGLTNQMELQDLTLIRCRERAIQDPIHLHRLIVPRAESSNNLDD